jgi:hypothetical protein
MRTFKTRVAALKELEIESKKTRLDEDFNVIFAVLRTKENTFQIMKKFKKTRLMIELEIKDDTFSYCKMLENTARISLFQIVKLIDETIDFISLNDLKKQRSIK